MEVVSTTGRGPNTIYTVKDGDTTRTIRGRANLPDDVFERWRKRQAAQCMARKRSRQSGQQDESAPNTETQDLAQQPFIDLTSSQESRVAKQPSQPVDKGPSQRALNMITCKVCTDAEVKKIIIPCGHLVFCSDCLTKAMHRNPSCPICRASIRDHFTAFMIE